MPLTTTSGYTFPVAGVPTTQTPNTGAPFASQASAADPKKSYSNWNGDWTGFVQYMAEHGTPEEQDKFWNYILSEASADKARQWTASREDTQYQRFIADAKKAGFNPYALASIGGNPISSASQGNSYSGSQYTTAQGQRETYRHNESTESLKAISTIVSVLGIVASMAIMLL